MEMVIFFAAVLLVCIISAAVMIFRNANKKATKLKKEVDVAIEKANAVLSKKGKKNV